MGARGIGLYKTKYNNPFTGHTKTQRKFSDDFLDLQTLHFLIMYFRVPLNTSVVVDELCLRWYMTASAMPAMHSFYGTETNTRMPYDLAGAYE